MLARLAKRSGIATPTADDLIRLDRQRKGKRLANEDSTAPTDPTARIAELKDGRTRLEYKSECAVDLDSGGIVAAEIHPAGQVDPTTPRVRWRPLKPTSPPSMQPRRRRTRPRSSLNKATTRALGSRISRTVPGRAASRRRRWRRHPHRHPHRSHPRRIRDARRQRRDATARRKADFLNALLTPSCASETISLMPRSPHCLHIKKPVQTNSVYQLRSARR